MRRLTLDYLKTESGSGLVLAAVAVAAVGVANSRLGGDYFARNLAALKLRGRIVHIAAVAGGQVSLNINRVMQKQAVVTGSTLRARPADEHRHHGRDQTQQAGDDERLQIGAEILPH